MTTFPLCLLFVVVGAILSRWHGGGINWLPKTGKVLKGLIYSLWVLIPIIILIFTNVQVDALGVIPGCLIGFVAWVSLAALKNTGHGNWFDLGHTTSKGDGPERLEFLISYLKDKLSDYWYDVLGMALKGGLMGFVLGGAASLTLVVETGEAHTPLKEYILIPLAALMAGAFSNTIGYGLGWYLKDKLLTKYPTEIGEYLGGFFFSCLSLLLFFWLKTLIPY